MQTEVVRSPSLEWNEFQEHELEIKMGEISKGIKKQSTESLVD